MPPLNRKKTLMELAKAIDGVSGIEFSFITGSFTQGKVSDIDILTVIKRSSANLDQLKAMVCNIYRIQLKNGFTPEADFPTEIATTEQIEDIINGGAFDLDNGKLSLKNYSYEELLTDEESDYRYWLYMLLTHRFDLLRGDMEKLTSATRSALITVFLYCFEKDNYSSEVAYSDLVRNMTASAGLFNYKLSDKHQDILLDSMDSKNFGFRRMGGNVISLNREAISGKIGVIKDHITSNKPPASHLITSADSRNWISSIKAL